MKNKLLLFFIPLLAKLPYLNLGYGPEEDSWGHVQNIWEMKMSGTYILSRLPGHPLFEGLLYALWPIHTPIVYNGLAALASSFAVLAFYQLTKHFQVNKPFLSSLAFAFVPIHFLSGTYTIDYSIGLCFVLWAYYYLVKQKIGLSAILLALAIGTRLSWAFIFVPLLFQLYAQGRSKKVLQFSLYTIALSLLLYFPLFKNYGLDFLTTYSLPYPPLAKAIYKATFGVWGVIGFIAITLFSIVTIRSIFKQKLKLSKPEITWLLIIGIYIALYIRLPEKSAFLLHIIPFLLLIILKHLTPNKVAALSALLLVSGFLSDVNITDPLRGSHPPQISVQKSVSNQTVYWAPFQGLYVSELKKRQVKNSYAQKVIDSLHFNKPTVVIAGWWYAMIDIKLQEQSREVSNAKFVYYLPIHKMKSYLEAGYEIAYLPEQERINDQKYQSTFTVQNAYPLLIK